MSCFTKPLQIIQNSSRPLRKRTCEGWPLITPIGSKQLTWSKFQALAALVTGPWVLGGAMNGARGDLFPYLAELFGAPESSRSQGSCFNPGCFLNVLKEHLGGRMGPKFHFPSLKLTACTWKIPFLWAWPIFRGYLSFREGKWFFEKVTHRINVWYGIFPQKGTFEDDFLFPRWDMLVPWRLPNSRIRHG